MKFLPALFSLLNKPTPVTSSDKKTPHQLDRRAKSACLLPRDARGAAHPFFYAM
jgi:hypothetical protein